jgi:hypothetical protein
MKKLITISFCLIFLVIGGCKLGDKSSVVGVDGKIDPQFITKVETAMKQMAKDEGWDYLGKITDKDDYIAYKIDSDKSQAFYKGGKTLTIYIYKNKELFKTREDESCKKSDEWSKQYKKGKICCSDGRVKGAIITKDTWAGKKYTRAWKYSDQYKVQATIDYEDNCSSKKILDLFLDKYFDE